MDTYEKKYKNALERAKAFELPEYKNIMESVFTELKESEGERIRKEIARFIQMEVEDEIVGNKWIAWLEKQGKCDIDCPQNHQDSSRPNGCIVLEDFNGGEGFYKLNLDYLNKRQVEEVEEMVRTWNKESKTSNENIKNCIGMCLTDVGEQRFNDYNTNLRDCLAWLERQGSQILANSAKTCKDEQKPGEWSEEDSVRLQRIIDFLWHNRKGDTDEIYQQEQDVDWLKSLKNRYTWKPCERQKEALLWCVVHLGGADKQTLGELLEELNKL